MLGVIKVMGYFSEGKSQTDSADRAQLPAGELPGDAQLLPRLHELIGRAQATQDRRSFVWIALFEPSMAEMESVGKLLNLAELEMEDAVNPRQRAKAELHPDRAFVVFKLLEYIEATSDIETGQMAVFVGTGYVVTVRFGFTSDMSWVLDRIDGTHELLDHGPVAILHAVLDAAADEYLQVVDEISRDIEQIEESVFSPERTDTSEAIYELKRENLEIRRAIAPLASGAVLLSREQMVRMPEPLRPYFRDIGDHIMRASDAIDTNDSLLLTMLMASTARQDLQQNNDMRRISAWVAMAAVPTMIAGIYGMNFDFMPELHAWWGYPAVLTFMAGACGLMFRAFKRSGWL